MALASTGFHALARILTGFLASSILVGLLRASRNEGKSLEQIEQGRALRA